MLKDGFYKVAFRGPLPGEGGIVVIEKGVVRGGDSRFLYSGKLELQGDGTLSGQIKVAAHVAGAQSVFGRFSRFTLKPKGSIDGIERFNVSGPVVDLSGGPHITIAGSRVNSLDLA